jgi:hypothetical protein
MTERWASDLEAKHGISLEQIPSQVYVLQHEVPQVVRPSVGGQGSTGPVHAGYRTRAE